MKQTTLLCFPGSKSTVRAAIPPLPGRPEDVFGPVKYQSDRPRRNKTLDSPPPTPHPTEPRAPSRPKTAPDRTSPCPRAGHASTLTSAKPMRLAASRRNAAFFARDSTSVERKPERMTRTGSAGEPPPDPMSRCSPPSGIALDRQHRLDDQSIDGVWTIRQRRQVHPGVPLVQHVVERRSAPRAPRSSPRPRA